MVDFGSPNFSLLKIESGIKLMLAPKSQRAFPDTQVPIENGIAKLLGSQSFGGSFFCRIALHSSVKEMVPYSSNFFLLANIFFMNFT